MDFDLFSCTFENLNNLKFNELQKLSSQYRVNKRWAKKREIIDKLLLLRDQELEKRNLISKSVEKNDDSQENVQWVDGKKVFSSAAINTVSNNDEIDRRLTYNVSNSGEDAMDRRLTFNVVKNETNQKGMRDVNLVICNNIDRRLTYNADEMKGMQKSLKSATENSKPETKIENVQITNPLQKDSEDATAMTERADKDFFGNEKLVQLDEESYINDLGCDAVLKTDDKVTGTCHSQTNKSTELKSAKAKMLTIPYSRIPAQRKSTIKEVKVCDNIKLKLPEKLSAIRKLNKSSIDISKPPHNLQNYDMQPNIKTTHKTIALGNQEQSLLMAKQNLCNPTARCELSNLNTRRILPRRKSKTEDNVLVANLKSKMKPEFYSPTGSDIKNFKRLSDGNRRPLDTNFGSKIPKAKPMVEMQKSLTAKKMPNFSKIHQKQFEQMDSILDYKRKKEERAKKLFGIPQPSVIGKGNTSMGLFQFKSTHGEKENQLDKSLGTIKKSLQTHVKQFKEKPKRQDMVNREESKSNIVTNVKEQNRKHLNGVRTNKRFELQMKFRKM